jgi:hypothetical protein
VSADRLRFALVLLPGLAGTERHALKPEVADDAETLCGLPRPGAWNTSGFTSRPDTEVDCSVCREYALALVADAVRPG